MLLVSNVIMSHAAGEQVRYSMARRFRPEVALQQAEQSGFNDVDKQWQVNIPAQNLRFMFICLHPDTYQILLPLHLHRSLSVQCGVRKAP